MLRSTLRANWMAVLALPALLAGGACFAFSRGGGVPTDGARVFYPALMLYNYTAVPLSILILLIAIALVVLWIPQALGRLPRFRLNGLLVVLALAASVLACAASLPQMLIVYRHIDRAVVAGRTYQLGARFALDEDNYAVVCDCDRLGLFCRCRHLAGGTPRVLQELPRWAVSADGTRLAVEMAGETIYAIELP